MRLTEKKLTRRPPSIHNHLPPLMVAGMVNKRIFPCKDAKKSSFYPPPLLNFVKTGIFSFLSKAVHLSLLRHAVRRFVNIHQIGLSTNGNWGMVQGSWGWEKAGVRMGREIPVHSLTFNHLRTD